MIAAVRQLADRPIADHERRRLFAAVALAIVLAAVLLSLTGQPHRADPKPHTPPSIALAAQASASHQRPRNTRATGRALRRVERAARRFLDGYLAYLYGHGDATQIKAASPQLKRRLRRQAPRVSPAARRRTPRVAALTTQPGAAGRYHVAATIADGGVTEYPIELTVARRDGRWLVISTAAH